MYEFDEAEMPKKSGERGSCVRTERVIVQLAELIVEFRRFIFDYNRLDGFAFAQWY